MLCSSFFDNILNLCECSLCSISNLYTMIYYLKFHTKIETLIFKFVFNIKTFLKVQILFGYSIRNIDSHESHSRNMNIWML